VCQTKLMPANSRTNSRAVRSSDATPCRENRGYEHCRCLDGAYEHANGPLTEAHLYGSPGTVMAYKYDVAAIGSPIVDVLAPVEINSCS
jgi:hypothetical protein